MEHSQCRNCQHYRQHYILFEHRLSTVYCGHCLLHRGKKIRPDTAACEKFLYSAEDPFSDFVSREYLYKELLKHVLSMELLPEHFVE